MPPSRKSHWLLLEDPALVAPEVVGAPGKELGLLAVVRPAVGLKEEDEKVGFGGGKSAGLEEERFAFGCL